MPAKKQAYTKTEEKPEPKKASDPLILSQSEHAKLSPKEKVKFRADGGTVSNQ